MRKPMFARKMPNVRKKRPVARKEVSEEEEESESDSVQASIAEIEPSNAVVDLDHAMEEDRPKAEEKEQEAVVDSDDENDETPAQIAKNNPPHHVTDSDHVLGQYKCFRGGSVHNWVRKCAGLMRQPCNNQENVHNPFAHVCLGSTCFASEGDKEYWPRYRQLLCVDPQIAIAMREEYTEISDYFQSASKFEGKCDLGVDNVLVVALWEPVLKRCFLLCIDNAGKRITLHVRDDARYEWLRDRNSEDSSLMKWETMLDEIALNLHDEFEPQFQIASLATGRSLECARRVQRSGDPVKWNTTLKAQTLREFNSPCVKCQSAGVWIFRVEYSPESDTLFSPMMQCFPAARIAHNNNNATARSIHSARFSS